MLPYSRDILFAVFQDYQSSWWGMIVLFYLGFLMGLGCLKQGPAWPRAFILGWMALAWAATGVLFFCLAFASYDFVATYEAAAFGVQSLLLLVAAAQALCLPAEPQKGAPGWLVNLMLLVGLLGLPLWDWLVQFSAGQDWRSALAAARWFGTAPGPTVVVTFAVLLRLGTRWWAWIIPLLWSCKAALVAHWLSVTVDYVIPLSGILALTFALLKVGFRTGRASYRSSGGDDSFNV